MQSEAPGCSAHRRDKRYVPLTCGWATATPPSMEQRTGRRPDSGWSPARLAQPPAVGPRNATPDQRGRWDAVRPSMPSVTWPRRADDWAGGNTTPPFGTATEQPTPRPHALSTGQPGSAPGAIAFPPQEKHYGSVVELSGHPSVRALQRCRKPVQVLPSRYLRPPCFPSSLAAVQTPSYNSPP